MISLQPQHPASFPLIYLPEVHSLYHNLNQHGPQALRIFLFTSHPSRCSHLARKTSAIRDGRSGFREGY